MTKAFLFGPNGKLGPIWLQALQELNYKINAFGLEEELMVENKSELEYSRLDIVEANHEKLKDLFNQLSPRVVVINSGFDSPPGTGESQLNDYSLDSWRKFFEINLLGCIKILNASLESNELPKRIVVIGSMYSETSPIPDLYTHYPPRGRIKHPAYSSSKSALLAAIKQYAGLFLQFGCTLNMLSPGAIQGNQDQEFVSKISSRIPLKRLGNPNELIAGIKFLLDESNTYFVGQNLIIDGGMNLW